MALSLARTEGTVVESLENMIYRKNHQSQQTNQTFWIQ